MSDHSEAIVGPLHRSRNWAADAVGSIHDDETAGKLGFRGGTVPGDVHINQFVPVVLERFGDEWWRSGHLSLMFKNATVDGEPVRAIVEPTTAGTTQSPVRIEREDGMLVCEGSAGVGDYSTSALRSRDLYPCEPDNLSILRQVSPSLSMGRHEVDATADRQIERLNSGLIGGPLSEYGDPDANGQVLACPSTIVQYLWGIPVETLRPVVKEAVGLFGAIEFAFDNGPWRLPGPVTIDSHVVGLSESPKTESLWFESQALDEQEQPIVTFRMLLRFMKASAA